MNSCKVNLSTVESFSTPKVYMSKREANVKLLKSKRRNALTENKEKVDVIIDLYASGKMPNYATAEKLIDRLGKIFPCGLHRANRKRLRPYRWQT